MTTKSGPTNETMHDPSQLLNRGIRSTEAARTWIICAGLVGPSITKMNCFRPELNVLGQLSEIGTRHYYEFGAISLQVFLVIFLYATGREQLWRSLRGTVGIWLWLTTLLALVSAMWSEMPELTIL